MFVHWFMLFAAAAAGDANCQDPFPREDPEAVRYMAEAFAGPWADVNAGRADDALAGFDRAIGDFDTPEYVRPLVYALATSAFRVQRLHGPGHALPYWLRARDIQLRLDRRAREDRERLVELEVAIGNAHQVAGRRTDAVEAYRRAQRAAARIGGRDGDFNVAMTEAFEASVAYDQRDYRRVESLVAAARERVEHPQVAAWTDILLAATYRQQGDYGEAQALLEDVIGRSGLDCARMLRALAERNLGELKIYYKPVAQQRLSERLDEALAHLERAQEAFRAIDLAIERAITMSHIAEIHLRRDDFEKAEDLLEKSLAEFERTGLEDGIGRSYHHLGQVARRQAEMSPAAGQRPARETAIARFGRALRIYEKLGDREWQWRSLLGRGAARESFDPDGAKEDYVASTAILVSMRASLAEGALPASSSFSDSYREAFGRLAAMLLREGSIDEALAAIATSDAISLREQYLVDAKSRAAGEDGRQPGGECADLLLRYPEQQPRSVVTSFVHNASDIRVTADASPQPADGDLPTPPVTLPAGAALLTYLVNAHGIDILLRSFDGEATARVPYAELALQDDVAMLVRLIRTASLDSPDRWRAGGRGEEGYSRELLDAAEAFHDALILPVSDGLSGVETLYIDADGVLELVPFSALARRGENGAPEFLNDRFDVRRYSGSFATGQGSAATGSPRVVAFADPENRGASRRERLAGSAQFAFDVLEPMFSADVFVDDAATKVNLRRAWSGANVLHIGAHGVVTTRSPYLLMAPDDVQGRLSSCEILDLPYHDRLELVVLEACESAVAARGSETANTRNLSSIGAAFGARGARNVVATLWRVGQAATSELMQVFYEELRAGLPPAVALRKAKDALRNSDGLLAQPYYWAGFTIFEKLEQGW